MKDCKIIFNLIYLLYYHFRAPVSAIFKLAFSRTRVVSMSVSVSVLVQLSLKPLYSLFFCDVQYKITLPLPVPIYSK